MKTITKYFATLGLAEAYQSRLYSRFDSVKLTGSPRFSEAGSYTWEVK